MACGGLAGSWRDGLGRGLGGGFGIGRSLKSLSNFMSLNLGNAVLVNNEGGIWGFLGQSYCTFEPSRQRRQKLVPAFCENSLLFFLENCLLTCKESNTSDGFYNSIELIVFRLSRLITSSSRACIVPALPMESRRPVGSRNVAT